MDASKLTPEKQLQLHLAQAGLPSTDIPKLLRYCPQLMHEYPLDLLAAVGITNLKEFTPKRRMMYLRSFVYDIAEAEAGRGHISDFIEEAVCMLAGDTIEWTLKGMLNRQKRRMEGG
jgi:hypothetical protein